MKQFSALALLVSSVAVANQNVTATGTGNSFDEARRDAMHQASMRHCTTAIVNDREYRNEEMTRNNLTAYNGCLVRNYTVVSQDENGGTFSVTINAEVGNSNLPSRIINNHPNTYFYDLVAHNDNVSQMRTRYKNGINLIDEVFYDFTNNAFSLYRNDYKIYYKAGESAFTVNYRVTWNKKFVAALEETLDLLKDKGGQAQTIRVNKGYTFADNAFPNQIMKYLAMPPVTRLRIMDSDGNEMINVCQQWRFWYNMYDTLGNNFNFNTSGHIDNTFNFIIPVDLPDNIEVKMDVVPNHHSFCKELIW